jgi:hypothetical protein
MISDRKPESYITTKKKVPLATNSMAVSTAGWFAAEAEGNAKHPQHFPLAVPVERPND